MTMLTQLYQRKTTFKPKLIDPHVIQLSPSDSFENGRTVRKVKFVSTCVDDNNKQFRITDFSIASILSVGATNMLRPVSMSNHDVESVAASVDRIGAEIDKAVAAAQQQQTPAQ